MKIAVASGKGGTGKTTIAVSLALAAADLSPGRTAVELLDCDVEEPNAHLFFSASSQPLFTPVQLTVPSLINDRCHACGACARFCQFHAIAAFGTRPLLFADMCHSCGGCIIICPHHALQADAEQIGMVEQTTAQGIALVTGRLQIGKALAPPVVRAVLGCSHGTADWTIIDSPPGTSCSVVAATRQADYVILVTEPTPFGLHDLKLAVEMVRILERPFGVMVNRATSDRRIHQFCASESIDLLAEIPDDRQIAAACSDGTALLKAMPRYKALFQGLLTTIRDKVQMQPELRS